MGAEDTWGKLQKIAKLVILRVLGFRERKSASKVSFIILSVT